MVTTSWGWLFLILTYHSHLSLSLITVITLTIFSFIFFFLKYMFMRQFSLNNRNHLDQSYQSYRHKLLKCMCTLVLLFTLSCELFWLYNCILTVHLYSDCTLVFLLYNWILTVNLYSDCKCLKLTLHLPNSNLQNVPNKNKIVKFYFGT